MSTSKPSRKFYIIDVTGERNINKRALTSRNGFVNTTLPAYDKAHGENKYGASNEEQFEAIKAAGYQTGMHRNEFLVIYRRADARRILAAMKADAPSWTRDFSPKLVEVGEFARHRDPRPIINWRVQVSKAPEGSTVKVGTVMANGFTTRDKARDYAKKSVASDRVITPGYEYEVLPNYGNI